MGAKSCLKYSIIMFPPQTLFTSILFKLGVIIVVSRQFHFNICLFFLLDEIQNPPAVKRLCTAKNNGLNEEESKLRICQVFMIQLNQTGQV